ASELDRTVAGPPSLESRLMVNDTLLAPRRWTCDRYGSVARAALNAPLQPSGSTGRACIQPFQPSGNGDEHGSGCLFMSRRVPAPPSQPAMLMRSSTWLTASHVWIVMEPTARPIAVASIVEIASNAGWVPHFA